MPTVTSHVRDEAGQAGVELVAVLPFVLLIGAVVWQLALVGHAAWACAHAARAAARAEAVGGDGARAARSVLPESLEREVRVRRRGKGGVSVSVRIPLLLRGGPAPLSVSATASLGASP